jgi:hypothetical protein
MQKVYGVINGDIAPYLTMAQNTMIMSKMIFVAPCMFWATLWCIKLSLLFLYRRLLVGLHKIYTVVWWVIVGLYLLVSRHPRIRHPRILHSSWRSERLHDSDLHRQLHYVSSILQYNHRVLDWGT